ncbi:MAG TPA: S41 family peptidase [Pirellulales bacterium]|nr:S41 family peptidase [Pirellulales bacterium]
MRFRVFLGAWACCLAVLCAFPLPVTAQRAAPNRAGVRQSAAQAAAQQTAGSAADAEIAELLNRAQRLEDERRWGEALTIYEDGHRQYPAARHLEQRLQICRIHYDLARRYTDRTFRDTIAGLTQRQATDLYSEVLLKIQAHYVDNPDWRRLAEFGNTSLLVALADPLFIEANLPGVSSAKIERVRRDLPARVSTAQVNNRHAAIEVASAAARVCRDDLGLMEAATLHEYVCGATNSLDPYSAFLTSSQLNEVYSQIEGNFVGLGVELKSDKGALLIVKVIPGSPAQQSGIVPGDRIVAVEGRTTSDLTTDQAANMLQGKEGSYVSVNVVTSGQQPRLLRVRREHVEVPSIDEARLIDESYGVAYVKLTCFQKTTTRDLDAALWRLHRQGMKSLVIDLRGNPGGLLNTAVEVVDKFVDRGTIVSTRGRSRQEDYTYTAREQGTWRVPLVVLIDGDSASASEIFAGAIRDFRRGRIVGATSYGKGSVQGIFPLNLANSGLRLTTAKFYSPKGYPYSGVGVKPDVQVAHRVARPNFDDAEQTAVGDEALEQAMREARFQVATPARQTAVNGSRR